MSKITSTLIFKGREHISERFSYSGLNENIDHLVIDNTYIRTLYLSGFPFVANSGWLDDLISFPYDCDISYHFQEVASVNALPKLNRKITELESIKRSMITDGKIIGSEITDPLESAVLLRDKILRGQQKLFQIGIYIALRAESLSELNKLTDILESTLASKLFFVKIARYRQLQGLQTILPRAEDELDIKRNLDSSSSALTFPFMSNELAHNDGIIYGVNKSNNSLVIIDRFKLQNANSIIFAQSGSGKSYLSKVEILRQLCDGVNVLVIDPENEYQGLCESVKGSYIKISASSKDVINPLEVLKNKTSKKDINQNIQDLISVISLMTEGLSNEEKATLDKALVELYKGSKKDPLLQELSSLLIKLKQPKLAKRLEKYVSGSLKDIFNKKTNIDLNNRLVVFNIRELSENIRPIMMMIISNFVTAKIQNKTQKTILVIDEAWILLEHKASAKFISGLVRRARKYFLGVNIISQQASDFLNNSYGKVIASQSSLRVLMRQDSTTIKDVFRDFNLSEYEYNFLLNSDRGEALMIVDQAHVAVRITASSKEHPVITTDPLEILDNTK